MDVTEAFASSPSRHRRTCSRLYEILIELDADGNCWRIGELVVTGAATLLDGEHTAVDAEQTAPPHRHRANLIPFIPRTAAERHSAPACRAARPQTRSRAHRRGRRDEEMTGYDQLMFS